MAKRIWWVLFGLSSVCIGLYPLIYFIIDREFGLLNTKPDLLLKDLLWNIAFYGHIVPGGIALLFGWIQFSKKIQVSHTIYHRSIGKLYVISALISGFCGLYIAQFATGGIISEIGFSFLAIVWISTTLFAFKAIKDKNIRLHQRLMIYSYAACFAAVTLRIWLPLLTNIMGGFYKAYPIVAWISWVPNLIIAYFISIRKNRSVSS